LISGGTRDDSVRRRLRLRLVLMGLVLVGLNLVAEGTSGEGSGGVAAVREELEQVAEGEGLSLRRALALGTQSLAAGRAARSNGAFFEAMTVMADLCQLAPSASARKIRGQALGLLGERFVDAVRWRVLAGERFQPPLESLPRDRWREEIAAYDELLDGLRKSASDERLQAAWLYAKAALRLRVNRRWDWLAEEERQVVIAFLEDIRGHYGALHLPGARGGRQTTYGELADNGLYEFRTLFFGAPAPPTLGRDLEDQPLDLMAYRGSVVVLDFWSTFCLPCLAMVPKSRALLEDLRGKPMVFLGVNGDQERDKGLNTARRTGMVWRSFWDGPEGTSGAIATAWRVRDWPTVIVLDAAGRIRFRFVGQQEAEDGLEGAVRRLLGELSAERLSEHSSTIEDLFCRGSAEAGLHTLQCGDLVS